MTLQARPFPVTDFTGGVTDNFVNAPINQAEIVDNFLLKENKSLIVRPGSHIEDPVNAQILPSGNNRIGTIINYDIGDKLFVQSGAQIYYRNPLAYSELLGPVDINKVFPTDTTANHMAVTQWKKHIFVTSDSFLTPKKIYKDGAGLYQLRTAGMPALVSDPTITPGAAGAKSFIYKFHYHYTYTAGNQEFQDFGPVTTVEVTGSDDPSANTNAISVIPVLANGVTESYDTVAVKIFIYRTIDGGVTAYKIGEVTNGTTVFSDTFADSTIQSNLVVYTEGGVLDNDSPPLAKYVHIVNNTAYYANLKEGSELLPSDVLQSAFEDPDSVPAANRITVNDEIRGMSSVQSIPIILCRKQIYRIEGVYDETGRGTPTAITINDTAGCVSNRSIVQAKDYVFWAGNDKFYASDGYKVFPISDHFNDRYKDMLSMSDDTENITGAYDEVNERIYWSVQTDSGNPDSDTLWILDLRWGLTQSSTFTSATGGDSFAPSAITFFNDELVRGDRRGYVFIHSDTDSTDPKVDTLVSPEIWKIQAIVPLYKGFATNFGTDALRKMVVRIYATLVNLSNVSVSLKAINDDGALERVITPIRYRGNFIWGDPEFFWGDPEFVWNSSGLINAMRRMPVPGLRLSYLQMEISSAKVVLTNSDANGNATVVAAALTVTMDDVTNPWILDADDYYISFDTDGYVEEFLIENRDSDTVLTIRDINGNLTDGSKKWVIRGVRKGEIMNLLSYTLLYSTMSQTQSRFEAGDSGENA